MTVPLLYLKDTPSAPPRGLNNGRTLKEIEEVLIQALPYVGYPASQQHWLLLPRLSRSVVWTSMKTTLATAACFATKRHPHCRC
jgi:hypothetical protein